MERITGVLIIVCILIFSGSYADALNPSKARSWALIIGINKYENPSISSLNYAVNDARSVVEALERFSFPRSQILTLIDQEANRQAIELNLYEKLSGIGPQDRLVIFFAGHGETLALPRGGKEGFLLPYDADPDRLALTAISMSDIKQMSQRIPANQILFIVDACYSGFASRRGIRPMHTNQEALRRLAEAHAVQVITAGQSNEQVYEEYGHGLFTQHLLLGLEGFADTNQDGLILGSELATFLQDRVQRGSSGNQHPQFHQFSGEGQFAFQLSMKTNRRGLEEVGQPPATPMSAAPSSEAIMLEFIRKAQRMGAREQRLHDLARQLEEQEQRLQEKLQQLKAETKRLQELRLEPNDPAQPPSPPLQVVPRRPSREELQQAPPASGQLPRSRDLDVTCRGKCI